MKRSGAKDGSRPVLLVCCVDPDKLEAEVLADCLDWLHRKGIFCNRHDVGGGDLVGEGHAVYGIKNAGDIIGALKDGTHFEIETKRGKGGRWTKGQQDRCLAVRATHAVYLLISGVEELEFYNELHLYF